MLARGRGQPPILYGGGEGKVPAPAASCPARLAQLSAAPRNRCLARTKTRALAADPRVGEMAQPRQQHRADWCESAFLNAGPGVRTCLSIRQTQVQGGSGLPLGRRNLNQRQRLQWAL